MSTPASILKNNENQGRQPKNPPGRPPAPPVNALPQNNDHANANRDPSQPPPPPVNPQPSQRPVSSHQKPLPPTIRENRSQSQPEKFKPAQQYLEDKPPQPPTIRNPTQFQPARPTLPGKQLPQISELEVLDSSSLRNSQGDGDNEVGIRNRVNSPQFQNTNLRGSEGVRSPASLKSSGLMFSTDSMTETAIYDARNHPQAHFARALEQFTSTHRKSQLHALKVIKIPVVEQRELRIKSYSESQILETPLCISADIYTAIAYGIYGDSTLGNEVRIRMVDFIREIANWLEEDDRSDITKLVDHMELEDLSSIFKHVKLDDDQAGPSDNGAASAPSAGPSEGDADGEKKKITEQGMVEDKKKKKKRAHQLTRDAARDQRYARALRQLSNDIASYDGKQGPYIHPLCISAIGAVMFNRPIYMFSVKPGQTKLHHITPRHKGTRLPVYLATEEKDTSAIYMLVPQLELHSFDENQLFFQRHVMDALALIPAYNEGEEEIMRTFLSFKKECKEEIQVIFFVDGVKKNGSDVNHNTLTALLKVFDFVKMGVSGPIARYGKDDLQALVADIMTLGDEMNATAEYMGQDRVDAVSHIALRVWVKKNNSGKKQSQLKFFEYLSKRCVQPRYLLFVDSDTRFAHPAVTALKVALDKANTGKVIPEIGGTTGEIVVENLNAGFFILGATQYFEYKMSHHLGKRAEASFGRVSCLAGAFSMFECRALMDPRVIADFAKDDSHNSIWEYNKKNLGEDRYLTAQLLEAGYGTSFEPKALSHTVAPSSLKGFIAQRRRWDNSTLVNQVDLIFAEKKSVFSLWGGRYTLPWVWNAVDFLFSLVMPGNMILLLVSIINSIIQLSWKPDPDNPDAKAPLVDLVIYAPIVAVALWIVFFLLPFFSKHKNILDLDLYILKLVSALVVTATILLFAYLYQTGSIFLILIATFVFLGPYAITLVIRNEVVCMLCGPLFLLMTPVMFLFLKFYALANFGERSWGTRDAAAKSTEKEQINTRFAIAFAGLVYLIINIGYMIVALKFAIIFMWVFSLLVSVTAITRIVASLALSKSLNTYRRMLGTVGMFDGLCAVLIVVLIRMMANRPSELGYASYGAFYEGSEAALFFLAIFRAFSTASWYLGMRRGGWIVFGLGVVCTIVEGALIVAMRIFDAYGAMMGLSAVAFTIAEGFLVWRTNTSPEKSEDNSGLCCYLAFIHNMVLLIGATIISYLPGTDFSNIRNSIKDQAVAATAPVVFFAAICGIWMYSLHFFRPRTWALVLHAIISNMIYLVVLIICGEVLEKAPLNSFSTGYYPYVAVLSMIFQLLLSWTAVRWAARIKSGESRDLKNSNNRATVNTQTGSMYPIKADV